jgi:hypothetical protein
MTNNSAPAISHSHSKRIMGIVLGTIALLLIPLAAMQFTTEVTWTLSDFVIAGVLLLSTGLIFNWATNKFSKHRVIVGALIVLVFLYVWAELAVGIFNIPGISGN